MGYAALPADAVPAEAAALPSVHVLVPFSDSSPFSAAGGPPAVGTLAAASTAAVVEDLEVKVSALSRRTAAEMRKAEKERADQARRLEVLEELCRLHLGGLETRLSQGRQDAADAAARMKKVMDKDLKQLSELVQQQLGEAQSSQEGCQGSVESLARRLDAQRQAVQELQGWRNVTGAQLAAAAEAAAVGAGRSGGDDSPRERWEDRLEAVVARERKSMLERLRSSCAELTGHLNDLRRELVEQRRSLAASHEDLETQLAELGGALAMRLQAKVLNLTEEFQRAMSSLEERAAQLEKSDEWFVEQLQRWRQEQAAVRAELLDVSGGRWLDELAQVAREEARTVHLEVMSLDTRLIALEDRFLSDDRGRRQPEALRSRAASPRSWLPSDAGGCGARGPAA